MLFRASQKRVSLVAGRQVTGLNLLGTDLDADVDPDAVQEWVMFGRGRGSPTEDSDPLSGSPVDDDEIRPDFDDADRSPSRRRAGSGSRPNTPPQAQEQDWHIGRAGQIKSLGRFNSSLKMESPPTPLRCASEQGSIPTIMAPDLTSSASGISVVATTPGDVHIPVEEAAPVYPSLDIPQPDWSLQRLSSSWSLSSSSHQHRHTSTSQSIRTRDSTPGRSTSAERNQDEIMMAMRRMKSSTSIKRMSSESGRRGGYLGGRTIEDYVIEGEAGRGAYGLVKRARERKKPVIGLDDQGNEVVLEDTKPDETVGVCRPVKRAVHSLRSFDIASPR